LRIAQESFGGWLHDTATENCFFLHLQERFRHNDQDNAFTTFTEYYEPIIKQLIYDKFPRMQKQDKEDIVQDVELRSYCIIPKFDGKGYSFRCWLRETTRGLCLNMIKKQKKVCFILTNSSFQKLRNEGIPNTVLESLKCLEDEEFTQDELLSAVECRIGKEQTDTYKKLIVKHAGKKYQEREIPLDILQVSTLPDPSPPPDFQDKFNFVQELIKLLPPKYREVVLLQQQGLQYEEITESLNIKMGTVKSRLNKARRLLIKMRKLVEERNITIERIRDRLREGKTSLTKILKELSQDTSIN
jgi:RNA polymerase sigma factor (sigma-70 family)